MLPSCLWSLIRILPISHRFSPTNFHRDASSLLSTLTEYTHVQLIVVMNGWIFLTHVLTLSAIQQHPYNPPILELAMSNLIGSTGILSITQPSNSVALLDTVSRLMFFFSSVQCVCVFSSHSIWTSSFFGRTSRGHTGGRSHRISHPPSFCGACLNFSRDKDSALPFPRRS